MRRVFLLALFLLMGCGGEIKHPLVSHGIFLGPQGRPEEVVSLKVPDNWELRAGLKEVALVAISPVRKGHDFRENLTVVSVPLEQGETGSAFVARSLKEASKLEGFQSLPSPDATRWALYRHNYGGQPVQVMAYFLTRHNSATTGAVDSSATTGAAENFGYIFAFSCAPDDFAETRGLFESIARTISVEPEQRQKMKELLDSLQKHDEVMNKHFPKH